LGETISRKALEGVDYLIHAAHDFEVKGDQCVKTNYEGSLPLLKMCRESGIPVSLVSTTSAFDGVDTGYGRAKLLLEGEVLESGGRVHRAGLIIGTAGGGIVGQLMNQLQALPIIPIVGPNATFYVTDEETFLTDLLTSPDTHQSGRAFLAASRKPETMRVIISGLLEVLAIDKKTFGVAPRGVYYMSKIAELIGVPFPFRSESVRYLMRQVSDGEINRLSSTSLEYPDFKEIILRISQTPPR